MLPNVIFLNGPPGCGKDFVADHLCVKLGYSKLKMTSPMDASLKALLGLNDEQYREFRETRKDEPMARFGGKSFRQVLIAFSEEFSKPIFGDDFFGQRGADTILAEPESRFVISDSGFRGEAKAIVDRVGADQCLLVKLSAAGCDFSGDSRGELSNLGCREVQVYNDKTEHAVNLVLDLVRSFEYT